MRNVYLPHKSPTAFLLAGFTGLALIGSASAATIAQPTLNSTHWTFSNSNTVADAGPGTMTAAGAAGSTDSFVTETVGGISATVLDFTARASNADRYNMNVGFANGGGVQQFTMIFDIRYNAPGDNYLGLWNGNPGNGNDSEFFLRPNTGGFYVAGSGSVAPGTLTNNTFHRVVYRGNHTGNDVDIFVDGSPVVGATNLGSNDFVFDNSNIFILLSDNTSGETSSGQLAAYAFVDTLLTDTEIANLGGVDGNGIFTQVPEPSSLALLGLGGLLVARRRRA